jgi:hypothetical protein
MNDDNKDELTGYDWMASRIPARDALSTFLPNGTEPDSSFREVAQRQSQSRWFPVEGGHRVLFPYDGEHYDGHRFVLEYGAWDHEHCDLCRGHIGSMVLCYVTCPDFPYVLLCADCFKSQVSPHLRPWWKFW